MPQNEKKTPQEPPEVKKLTFNVGFSALMTALTVLVGCVVVAFMMGVIVGRDQEREVPGMEKILPAKPIEKQAEAQSPPNTQSGQAPYVTSDRVTAQKSKLMTPEELKYANALKVKEQATPDTQSPSALPSAQAEKPSQSAATAQTPNTEKKEAATVLDYVFQVSSLKDEKAVDTLRADLEGEGMRTRMTKSASYYIVFVLVRGTEVQAEAVRERLIAMKLGNPLQKQKTPVR